ncbi:MAG: DUF2924 domain-containing protein, partial [Magnetococcales bacterium]|nr:DUF2924 domain-containing protein [Magnetococcales bacterium]
MTTLSELVALPGKTTKELNQLWRKLYNSDPPQYGKDYLVRKLAFRVQELGTPGITDAAYSVMDGLARGKAMPGKKLAKKDSPAPGARLIREWQGVEHTVCVLDDGFEYQGKRFKSLS